MTIYAMFSPKNKMLIRGDYRKSFDVEFTEKGLKKMLEAIRVQEKTIVFVDNKSLYLKVRFSPVFNDYCIEKKPFFDENSRNKDFDWIEKDDYIECEVDQKWQNILGRSIAICNTRLLQLKIVNDLDLCTFLATDIEELKHNLLSTGKIGEKLTLKFILTDEEING